MVGKRFGKKLLIPQVSPHKSIEGAFGGLLFSIMGALASRPFVHYSYWHLMFLGVFLGILAQLGDLSESLIKRDCGVKDSGHLFPGLGGILDLIDSLLFTAPVFYFYMSIILK
jgi:phosphatidate cytidylyltransferase